MQIQKPKAILFDFDDTLVSSQTLINEALKDTLKEFGLEPWTDKEIQKWSVKSGKDYFPMFFKDKALDAKNFYFRRYLDLSSKGLPPFAGAIEILEYLNNLPDKPYLGVVSNKTGNLLRDEVKNLGWNKYFGSVVGSGDALEDKPSAAPILYALEGTGIDPMYDQVWFIGDSHVDMQAAHSSNSFGILIRENFDEELFSLFPPRIKVQNHKELLEFFKSNLIALENK